MTRHLNSGISMPGSLRTCVIVRVKPIPIPSSLVLIPSPLLQSQRSGHTTSSINQSPSPDFQSILLPKLTPSHIFFVSIHLLSQSWIRPASKNLYNPPWCKGIFPKKSSESWLKIRIRYVIMNNIHCDATDVTGCSDHRGRIIRQRTFELQCSIAERKRIWSPNCGF